MQISWIKVALVMEDIKKIENVARREDLSLKEVFSLNSISLGLVNTSVELCQKVDITPSRASLIINKLEKKGLIKRTLLNTDRRFYSIDITEKGRDVLARLIFVDNLKVSTVFEA